MRLLVAICIALFPFLPARAQNDTSSAINHLTALIKEGKIDASALLRSKEWMWLHPSTAFRELVRAYPPQAEIKYVSDSEPGLPIDVEVQVLDPEDKSLPGAPVYCYQTDARGWYAAESPHIAGNEGDRKHARLFAWVKTDEAGRFRLHTIKPGGYPQGNLPSHIHIEIRIPGYLPLITELLFDDDPRLTADSRARAVAERFVIAKAEKNTYRYTLRLVKA